MNSAHGPEMEYQEFLKRPVWVHHYLREADGTVRQCQSMEDLVLAYEQRRVANTAYPSVRILRWEIIPFIEVSTVFLSLDHGWVDGGQPILWETMIFGGPCDGYQERYTDELSALVGHGQAERLARLSRWVGRRLAYWWVKMEDIGR